jgi:L-fuconolactonase
MTRLRIDAHQHFWSFVPENYSWIGEDMSPLRRDYTPGDLEPELTRAGIDGTIAVEARGHLDETNHLLAIAALTPFVRGVVGWLPLTELHVQALVEQYAAQPKLKGLRHWMGAADDSEFMSSEALHQGVSLLTTAGLTYDVMIWPSQLGATARFVDRHPHQVFVVDHLAKPFIKARQLEPWRSDLAELAQRPNVFCKLSGLTTEADHERWSVDDLRPYFDAALEAFSPQRLIFGSDWPVCTLATSYARWAETVTQLLSKLSPSESEAILGGTAMEAYSL